MMRPSCAIALQWAFAAGLLTACGGGDGSSADIQVPHVTLTSPLAFADIAPGTLALSATASDNVRIAHVEYQIDGRTVASTSTSPSYPASVATANYASGQHVLRVRALDAAGNASAWSSATLRFGGSVAVQQGFSIEPNWVAQLSAATAMTQAPDGRWFVAEQGGTVRIVKDGVLLPTPFMQLVVNALGERGVIGIALHPDFANNGWVYVHYTTGTAPIHNRVSRFRAVPANADTASANSEEFIVDQLPPLVATNHNGGAIHFGIDRKLYVGVGDNAVRSNAPDLSTPLGKLLRFDDDGTPSSEK